jgi:exoribonuclease R
MLPTMLSDFLCSLQEKQTRFAFTLDLLVNQEGQIIQHSFKNTCICVKKNYRYNDDISDIENISEFKNILNKMNKFNKYINKINDTHNIVSYLMILMNYLSAKELIKYKSGIFRSMKLNNHAYVPDYLPNNIQDFLRMWKSNGSKYISFEEDKIHEMLKLNEYIHITSPIRRLVDLLNMTEIQHHIGIMPFNNKSKTFHDYWTCTEKLSYINQSMQSIRKLQNECDLLTKCILEPTVLTEIYEGYIFDVMERNDGLFQYVVYIQKLKLINKFISYKKLDIFTSHNFKLYLFDDRDTLKQKVRYELNL